MSQEKELDPYYQSGESGVEHRNIGAAGDGHRSVMNPRSGKQTCDH